MHSWKHTNRCLTLIYPQKNAAVELHNIYHEL